MKFMRASFHTASNQMFVLTIFPCALVKYIYNRVSTQNQGNSFQIVNDDEAEAKKKRIEF